MLKRALTSCFPDPSVTCFGWLWFGLEEHLGVLAKELLGAYCMLACLGFDGAGLVALNVDGNVSRATPQVGFGELCRSESVLLPIHLERVISAKQGALQDQEFVVLLKAPPELETLLPVDSIDFPYLRG
ncbi:hypothetical protein VNO78_31423 [Psophocarpus tetragonolobus]|uniref:Uncharacterized protein n=1 Tax=Psophocarpus tetragonolobus TaxID=3891 RepID=A0AAN9RYI9_PSOTE